MKRKPRFREEAYTLMRRRMIRETERAILYGLCHPGRVPRIPRIEVGLASFHPVYAEQFWQATLGLPRDVPATRRSRKPLSA